MRSTCLSRSQASPTVALGIGTSRVVVYPIVPHWRNVMSLSLIVLIIVILLLVGALPRWPHSRSWGYFPSGILGLIVVIIVVLLLLGRI